MLKFSKEPFSLKLGKQLKDFGFFKEPMKQEQTLLYQGDTFELDSVQCIFYNDTRLNMSMIVKYSNPTTTEIDRARNNRYFSSKLD